MSYSEKWFKTKEIYFKCYKVELVESGPLSVEFTKAVEAYLKDLDRANAGTKEREELFEGAKNLAVKIFNQNKGALKRLAIVGLTQISAAKRALNAPLYVRLLLIPFEAASCVEFTKFAIGEPYQGEGENANLGSNWDLKEGDILYRNTAGSTTSLRKPRLPLISVF